MKLHEDVNAFLVLINDIHKKQDIVLMYLKKTIM